MQIVRRMARRSVTAVAGLALAGAGFVAVGAGTAYAEAVNIDAGAVTYSRPAATPADVQVCAEGAMRIERDGATRVEHADCSVSDVMGVSVTRAAAAPSAAVFGEREVPVQAAATAAAVPTADYPAPPAPPVVAGVVVQRLPVSVDPASQTLPVTGGSVLPLALGGAGALAMGATAVVMARRRRQEVVAAQ